MSSVSFPALLPPPVPAPQVGAVVAVSPAAAIAAGLLAGGADGAPLPFSQTLAAPAALGAPAPDAGTEGAAMRPDQALLARQLAYPAPDAAGLARNWRDQVRNRAGQLARSALAASSGQLAPALLLASQQGQVVRPAELPFAHPDAWRFTVQGHGAAPQHLAVLAEEADRPPGRRRRPRAALRLELLLGDGSAAVIEVEPLPQGVAITLCAPDAPALGRLRALQPQLEQALGAAGVSVLRWQYRDRLPAGRPHAGAATMQGAAQALSPAVFRTVAELALVLPARTAEPDPS